MGKISLASLIGALFASVAVSAIAQSEEQGPRGWPIKLAREIFPIVFSYFIDLYECVALYFQTCAHVF